MSKPPPNFTPAALNFKEAVQFAEQEGAQATWKAEDEVLLTHGGVSVELRHTQVLGPQTINPGSPPVISYCEGDPLAHHYAPALLRPLRYVYFVVDLETWGKRSKTSAITSIGVRPFTYGEGRGFALPGMRVAIDPSALMRDKKVHVDHDTLLWWMGQQQGARDALQNNQKNAVPESEAIKRLKKFILHTCALPQQITRSGDKRVAVPVMLGYGASFDLAMVEEAYFRQEREWTWHHTNSLCARSLLRRYRDPVRIDYGLNHDPLDDATSVALSLIASAWTHGEAEIIY